MRRINVWTGAQIVSSQASLLPKVSFMACLRTHTVGQKLTVAKVCSPVTQTGVHLHGASAGELAHFQPGLAARANRVADYFK